MHNVKPSGIDPDLYQVVFTSPEAPFLAVEGEYPVNDFTVEDELDKLDAFALASYLNGGKEPRYLKAEREAGKETIVPRIDGISYAAYSTTAREKGEAIEEEATCAVRANFAADAEFLADTLKKSEVTAFNETIDAALDTLDNAAKEDRILNQLYAVDKTLAHFARGYDREEIIRFGYRRFTDEKKEFLRYKYDTLASSTDHPARALLFLSELSREDRAVILYGFLESIDGIRDIFAESTRALYDASK